MQLPSSGPSVFNDDQAGQEDPDPNEILTQDSLSLQDVSHFINELKNMITTGSDPKDALHAHISAFERKVGHLQKHSLESVDKKHVKYLIEKHPYFKNPNNYVIRLITIMKYLKKKGINTGIKDIDLLVDDIVQTIDGVKKVDYGKYVRVK